MDEHPYQCAARAADQAAAEGHPVTAWMIRRLL